MYKYINYRFEKYLKKFLLNGVNFKSSLYLFDCIFVTKNVEDMMMFFVGQLYHSVSLFNSKSIQNN
jgi:hypothetical protein